MPLRDHFRPPVSTLASWEELHGAWPGLIAFRLNSILPPEYRSGIKIHLGNLDTEELTPPEYEVRVYDQRKTRRLVAAVEIVSPRNKDRAESRDAFVSKCHALLQEEVCVVIVDPVTERSANLYAELADRLGANAPTIAGNSIYAVSCRSLSFRDRHRVEAWQHTLEIGSPLPTLPLWLTDNLYVPLELEATYEDTCRGLRIA
ncbi:DUF4058 family protein [Zavarzinella formosa]|uniref:DUF4058 family protein n=1 Tax=Zavarzinella formosa TaxID=360055 RepID=UPI0002D5576F|nr:DUF4058 family protein [Zavarzinella formosa]